MFFVQQTRNLDLKMVTTSALFLLNIKSFNGAKRLVSFVLGCTNTVICSNKHHQLRVTSFIIHFCGVPLSWNSRSQSLQILWILKNEHMTCVDVVKASLRSRNVLQPLGLAIRIPMIAYVGNLRANHLGRRHFVCEFYQNGILLVKFAL